MRAGYGLTETAAGGTIQLPDDSRLASVGAVIPCAEIKLVQVDDMPEYSVKSNQGEVYIRGATGILICAPPSCNSQQAPTWPLGTTRIQTKPRKIS